MALELNGTTGVSLVQDGVVTSAKIADGAVAAAKLASGVGIAAGTIAYFSMSTAPTGWLKANGATISRTTYADLFSAIGETYGSGDGSTTFQIPDLRGQFPRGWDDGRGSDNGRVFGSDQDDQVKDSSTRPTNGWGIRLTNGNGSQDNPIMKITGTYDGKTYNGGVLNTGLNYGDSGADQTHPKNVALLACIKF